MYLANKYNIKAILINPSIYSYKTLMGSLGEMTNYFDGSSFSWVVFELIQNNFMLLVQKGDATLDYKEALVKLPNAKLIAEKDL